MISLFPDEQIVTESNGKQVILTTHRICYEYKEWGRSYNQSIMLEHITSCENHSSNTYAFLVIAGVLVLLGVAGGGDIFPLCIGVALIFTVLFWITRKSTVTVGSPSTRMIINVTGMKRDRVLAFINNIEQTKHQRLLSLNRNHSN